MIESGKVLGEYEQFCIEVISVMRVFQKTFYFALSFTVAGFYLFVLAILTPLCNLIFCGVAIVCMGIGVICMIYTYIRGFREEKAVEITYEKKK